jgi:hypothetical protein
VSDLSRGGNNPSFGTGRDIAGIVLFAIGLFWEAVGDIQKASPFINQCRRADKRLMISTDTNHQTHLRDNHVPKDYGISPDIPLTLEKSSSTGVFGSYVVCHSLLFMLKLMNSLSIN